MTAINSYGKGPLGLLLTDTAFYNAQGVVEAFGRKAVGLPQHRMALAVRGDSRLPQFLADKFEGQFDDFDDFVKRGEAVMLRLYAQVLHDLDVPGGEPHFDLVVVGWSEERARAETYGLSSFDHPGGLPSFRMQRHDYIIAPSFGAGQLNGDPRAILRTMIERQRAAQWPIGTKAGAHQAHIVGGEAVLITVSRETVIEETIVTWPDEIGKPITPDNVAPKLNRHQRRAAARKAA